MPEKYITGEGHVPSMRNCSEVCCRNKRTLCSGSWPPPRIAFSPFLFAIMMDSLMGNIRKEAPWHMMLADDVVLCAREKDDGVGTGAVEGSFGEERNVETDCYVIGQCFN